MKFRVYFRRWIHVIWILVAFIATSLIFSYFSHRPEFIFFQNWAQANFYWFGLILILIKAFGTVWPPLPGLVFTISAIPVIGWLPAFLFDALGWYLGATIAFLLSRRYGLGVVRFFFGESGVANVKSFKVNPKRELEILVIMKVLGASLGEFINYAAGLSEIKFRNFFLSNVIASLILGLPLFYLFQFAWDNNNLLYAIIPLCLGSGLIYYYRDRYFIWEKEKPLD